MSERRNCYDILGVPSHATAEEVRRAFRKGALRWHPDRCRADKDVAEGKFKELIGAYRLLSDPEKRRQVDRQLREDRRGLSPQQLWEMHVAAATAGGNWTHPGPIAGTAVGPTRESAKAYASVVLAVAAVYLYPLIVPSIALAVSAVVLSLLARRDLSRGLGTDYSRDMASWGQIVAAVAATVSLIWLGVWTGLR